MYKCQSSSYCASSSMIHYVNISIKHIIISVIHYVNISNKHIMLFCIPIYNRPFSKKKCNITLTCICNKANVLLKCKFFFLNVGCPVSCLEFIVN